MSRSFSAKVVVVVALASLLATGLISGCATKEGYQGAAVGAGVGGLAGALIGRHNRWRGGVIGGALGAVLGGSLAEISARSSREAAQARQPVYYRSEDGRQMIYEEPVGRRGGCSVVVEKYYEDGRLMRTREREVCPR